MGTLRLPLVGTVMLALLGGLSGAAVAQSDESSRSGVTMVTGERLSIEVKEAERIPDGGYVRWPQAAVAYSWSDPRLPAEMRVRMNVVDDHVFAGAVLLEGPGGYWSGTWETFIGDGGKVHGLLRLTGYGAYDGLIVEGHMPPIPEPFDLVEWQHRAASAACEAHPARGGLHLVSEMNRGMVAANQTASCRPCLPLWIEPRP